MSAVLLDHHLEGCAPLLMATISATGMGELAPVRFVTFVGLALPIDITDRALWRFAQAHDLVLLTGNRNEDDEHSLGRTLQQEGTPTALPIVTIGRVARLAEREYRERCMFRLVDILADLDSSRGAGRLFIP